MPRILPPFLVPTLVMSSPSFAEPPMNVDDAGTLDRGGMKIEGVWRKDDKMRGTELVFGFSPLRNIEVGMAVARDHDHADDPATRFEATGACLKWVPIQNDAGWSFGATLNLGRTRVTDHVTPDSYAKREIAFNGLATWRTEAGNTVHLNLGEISTKQPENRDTVGTWGMGYEHPLAEHLKLTAEIFGQEQSRPDKAIGLRYEILAGLKLYGAIGRGNDRSFGNLGFAWEF